MTPQQILTYASECITEANRFLNDGHDADLHAWAHIVSARQYLGQAVDILQSQRDELRLSPPLPNWKGDMDDLPYPEPELPVSATGKRE